MSSTLFRAVRGGEEHRVRLLPSFRGRPRPVTWSWGCSCKRYLRMGRHWGSPWFAAEEARAHVFGSPPRERRRKGGRDA